MTVIRKITWRPVQISPEIVGIEVKETEMVFWLNSFENLCFARLNELPTLQNTETRYMTIDDWRLLIELGFDIEDAVHKAMIELGKGEKGNWKE